MLNYGSNSTAVSYPACIISTIVFFTLLFYGTTCTPFELLIGTGDTDSFSYFAGKTICRSIKVYDKTVSCRLIPTRETADNLTNLQNNSIDLALVSSKTIYDAFNNRGYFKYITIDYNNLRLLTPYYKSPVSLITRRDAQISSLNDLVGKRVNSGEFNSLEHLIFTKIMAIKGWDKTNFPLFQNISPALSQDSLALKRGSVQVMLHVGMHPENSLRQLLLQSGSTLVPLNDADIRKLVDDRVGFSYCEIAAGIYPGIAENLTTLAMETLLIASDATDDDTVQLVLTALNQAKQQLQRAHPSLLRQHITVMNLNEGYLHPHPSALLFFQSTKSLY